MERTYVYIHAHAFSQDMKFMKFMKHTIYFAKNK
jgi:hypothetical protein